MMKSHTDSLSRKARALIAIAFALAPIPAAILIRALIAHRQFRGVVPRGFYMRPGVWVGLPVFGHRLFFDAYLTEVQLILLAIGCGIFLAAYIAWPEAGPIVAALRSRWTPVYTAAALALTCAGIAGFILHYGNRQWGGYDFSFLIDAGWRLAQGQSPYRDFPCTVPPGFYLGLKYAFQIFGVRWQAVLLAAAIFAQVTLVWLYFLLAEVLDSRAWAYFGAVALQCAAMLTICYWWYNNVTTVSAVIFFVSCLLYLKRPNGRWPQLSYVASLALLGLMKPNVAFLTAASCITFTLMAASTRARLLLLTLLAVATNMAFLAANHVDLAAMITSYLGVAGSRGLTLIGFEIMETPEIVRMVLCVAVLAIPFLVWWPRFVASAKKAAHDKTAYGDLAYALLLLCAPVVSLFAMCTNGELKDVDWLLWLCFGFVVFLAGPPEDRQRLARTYFCLVLALAVSDLYIGVVRFRVRLVGDFFSTEEIPPPSGVPFLGEMRAGQRFHDVIQEVQEVLPVCPRPVFFGPRMEFAYAAFRLPSPPHMPLAWWYPGTTFGENEEPMVRQSFQDQCFETLIFSKDDFTDFSKKFMEMIASSYELDDNWERITVFRRLGTPACTVRR